MLDTYHAILGHKQKKACLRLRQNGYILHHLNIAANCLQRRDASDTSSDVRAYSGDQIGRISKIIGAVASSFLSTLAILVLYFVERIIIRIGLVIIFTTLFSTALAVFTDGRKVEVFSATAA